MVYVKNIHKTHEMIKEFAIQWAKENKEKIIASSFTKVLPTLEPLLKLIEEQYEVKDIRVVTKAIIDEEKGRKDLLAYLKGLLLNEHFILDDSKNDRLEVKRFMENWAKENKNYLKDADFKKARGMLEPLAIEINKHFGYKIDVKHRTLQRALFGEDLGCNNVLLYLKKIAHL